MWSSAQAADAAAEVRYRVQILALASAASQTSPPIVALWTLSTSVVVPRGFLHRGVPYFVRVTAFPATSSAPFHVAPLKAPLADSATTAFGQFLP